MKKLFKFLLLPILTMSLGACNIFDLIPGSVSDAGSYEEYFTKEKKYTKFTDITSLNEEIDEKAYFWNLFSEDNEKTVYITGKYTMVFVYKTSKKVLLSFKDGSSIVVSENNGSMEAYNDRQVKIDEDGKYLQGSGNTLKVAKDNDGWLFVIHSKHMVYVEKDYKKFYICENNTDTFTGYQSTKKMASSELLTTTLASLGADIRLTLPAPKEGDYEIWGGVEYYKNKPSNYSFYIADAEPKDYAKVLEANGFIVNRSYEDPYYSFYGEQGGYWVAYDETLDMQVVMSANHYLYINSKGQSYGPLNNIYISVYRNHSANHKEIDKTTQTTWKQSDLDTMAAWYDGTIDASIVPFPQIAKYYIVPSIMTYAHSGLLDGTFAYGQQCYNITDMSPYYFLDGYDQKLEAAGFHKYVPAYDLSNNEESHAFFNTEECKYVECFINQTANIAVKYYYDPTNGNTVRVFKLSEMKSWMTDLNA